MSRYRMLTLRDRLVTPLIVICRSRWVTVPTLFLFVVCSLLQLGIWRHTTLLSANFSRDGDRGWVYTGTDLRAPAHRLLQFRSDRPGQPVTADLELLDAIGPLGPAHAPDSLIQTLGGGRYAYRSFRLLLSTRDGREPAPATGLKATASVVPRPELALAIDLAAALIFTIAVISRSVDLRRRRSEAPTSERQGRFETLARLMSRWLFTASDALASHSRVLVGLTTLFLATVVVLDANLLSVSENTLQAPNWLAWLIVRAPAYGALSAGRDWIHLSLQAGWTVLGIWIATVCLALKQFRGSWNRATLVGLAGFMTLYDVALLVLWLPQTVLPTPDTPCYWNFCAMRTSGYPMLLHLFALFPSGLLLLVAVQFAAAAAATLLLAGAVIRCFGSRLFAIALAVLLTVKQGLVAIHFSMMTDSLFFSCCTAALACAILCLECARWRAIAGIILALTGAALLRPAVLGVVPPFFLLAFLLWPKSRVHAVTVAVGIVASLFVNSLIQPLVAAATASPHAGAGAMAGFTLAEDAAFLLTRDTPSSNPALRDVLADDAAFAQRDWRNASTGQARNDVLLHDGDGFLYGHALDDTCRLLPSCKGRIGISVENALEQISIEAIRHDPIGMLHLVGDRLAGDITYTFTGDWLSFQSGAFDLAKAAIRVFGKSGIKQITAGYRQDATAELMAPDTLGIGSFLFSNWQTIHTAAAIICAAAFAGFACLTLFRRSELPQRALGVASMGVISYHLLLVIGQTPFGRYTDAIAGWTLLTVGGSLLLVVRWLINRIGSVSTSLGFFSQHEQVLADDGMQQ